MLKNLLFLSAFSAFAVIAIVGLNIYHNSTLSSLPTTTQNRVVPITPTFDKETIDSLRERTKVDVRLSDKTTVTSSDEQGLISPNTPESTKTASESANSL